MQSLDQVLEPGTIHGWLAALRMALRMAVCTAVYLTSIKIAGQITILTTSRAVTLRLTGLLACVHRYANRGLSLIHI